MNTHLHHRMGWFCVALIVVCGCSRDYLPTPSGKLTGTVAPIPESWTGVAADKIIQLETQSTDPYSVNLWIVGEGDRLNVFAGDSRTKWVEHIDVDANVRLKIGESIYELQAQRVTDAAEFETFAVAWKEKYGNRPRNENVTETYLFRLVPRSS